MNDQIFYKLGSLFLGIICIVLVGLIFAPQYEYEKNLDINEINDELRVHRQLLLEYANSDDPAMSPELKSTCREHVEEIDSVLYSKEEISFEKELEIRQRVKILTANIRSERRHSPMLYKDYVIKL